VQASDRQRRLADSAGEVEDEGTVADLAQAGEQRRGYRSEERRPQRVLSR
jgi:hypothetical protein